MSIGLLWGMKPPSRLGYAGALVAFIGLVLVSFGLSRHGAPFSLTTFLVGTYLILLGAVLTFYARTIGGNPLKSRPFLLAALGITFLFTGLASGEALIDLNMSSGMDISSSPLYLFFTALFYLGLLLVGASTITELYFRLHKPRRGDEA